MAGSTAAILSAGSVVEPLVVHAWNGERYWTNITQQQFNDLFGSSALVEVDRDTEDGESGPDVKYQYIAKGSDGNLYMLSTAHYPTYAYSIAMVGEMGGANVSGDQAPYIFPMSFIYIPDIANMSFLYTNPARPAPTDLLHPPRFAAVPRTGGLLSLDSPIRRGLPGPRASHQGRRSSAAEPSGHHDPGLRHKIFHNSAPVGRR